MNAIGIFQEGRSYAILYVEDDPFVRESMQELLELYFDHVDIAQDGEEGLRMYDEFYEKHGRFHDLVITDINMPKMNGIDMIEAIKKRNQMQPVIVVSAHNEPHRLVRLIELDVHRFLPKPLDVGKLEEAFHTALNEVDRTKKRADYFTLKMMQKTLAALKERNDDPDTVKQLNDLQILVDMLIEAL